MKLTKLINIFGWSCLLVGSALFFVPSDKPNEQLEVQATDPYAKGKLCLREMLWYEARGTSEREMQAILDVALNRYRSARYPDRICKVIKQSRQYSYRNNLHESEEILPAFQDIVGKSDREAYITIARIVEDRFNADEILDNRVLGYNVTHYHTKSIKRPYWARSKKFKEVTKGVDKGFKHRYYSYIG